MAIRNDPERIEERFEVNNTGSRADIRSRVLTRWMGEISGNKYRYFVETLSDGNRVYLERPAQLNKGCDFVIYIENLFVFKNGNDRPPSHSMLHHDLCEKKNHLDSECWRHLIASIEAVHGLTSYAIPPECGNEINRTGQMDIEQIQLLCKWLFIEQDVTYWARSGRDMLLEAIQSI